METKIKDPLLKHLKRAVKERKWNKIPLVVPTGAQYSSLKLREILENDRKKYSNLLNEEITLNDLYVASIYLLLERKEADI